MIKDGVSRIVDGFASYDDDVTPVMFMLLKNRNEEEGQEFELHSSPIPGEFLASGEAKDYFAEKVIPSAGRVFRPIAMAMVNASWAIAYDGEAKRAYPDMEPDDFCEAICREYGSIGASPYAFETVSAVIMTRTEAVTLTARISRSPDGSSATLGEWHDADTYGGRFPDALRKALSYDD